jgi:hypothetical protein
LAQVEGKVGAERYSAALQSKGGQNPLANSRISCHVLVMFYIVIAAPKLSIDRFSRSPMRRHSPDFWRMDHVNFAGFLSVKSIRAGSGAR